MCFPVCMQACANACLHVCVCMGGRVCVCAFFACVFYSQFRHISPFSAFKIH